MPGIPNIPVDNIDYREAVTSLSKTKSGALFVIALAAVFFLIAVIVVVARDSNSNCAEEKAALRRDIERRDKRILLLESSIDIITTTNKALEDSLSAYSFIGNFNVSKSPGQVVLQPKKRIR